MKVNKIVPTLILITGLLSSCNSGKDIKPTSLEVIEDNINLIINSERDLNDIVTIKYNHEYVLSGNVTFESDESDIFTLNGSIIKANKLGSGLIKVTSNINSSLSDEFTATVYNPTKESYKVNYNNSNEYRISGLEQAYYVDDIVSFGVEVTNSEKIIDKVTMNDIELSLNEDNKYSFKMPSTDAFIIVTLKDKPVPHKVNYIQSDDYTLTGLKESYIEGEEVNFSVEVNKSINKVVDQITMNGSLLTAIKKNQYSFMMPDIEVNLVITLKDKPISQDQDFGKYNIECKSGGKLNTPEEILETFKFDTSSGEQGIIESISDNNNITAGGNGGSGTNRWKLANLLKFGLTKSYDGFITLNLSEEVNRITIYGYVHNAKVKLQVGDASSSDWQTSNSNNETTTVVCSDMTVASKATIEAGEVSSLVIDFAPTSSLKIAAIDKGQLFLTGISFSYVSEGE